MPQVVQSHIGNSGLYGAFGARATSGAMTGFASVVAGGVYEAADATPDDLGPQTIRQLCLDSVVWTERISTRGETLEQPNGRPLCSSPKERCSPCPIQRSYGGEFRRFEGVPGGCPAESPHRASGLRLRPRLGSLQLGALGRPVFRLSYCCAIHFLRSARWNRQSVPKRKAGRPVLISL
jgi:hypothetical protein